MKETTLVVNAQITFIRDDELCPNKKILEEAIKEELNADDVKISNLRRFEMDKE